jgi:hypothetical protein
MSSRFLYYLLDEHDAGAGAEQGAADEAGFLTVNPKTLQHVK